MAFVEAVLLLWCAVRMRKGLPNPVPAAHPAPALSVPAAHPAPALSVPAAHPVPALEVAPLPSAPAPAPRRGRQRRQPPPPPPARRAGHKLPDGDLIYADQAF